MTQEKLFIQNRNGEKIAVLVDHVDNPKELAFVMHGLSGTKEQPHIQIFADAFIENNITVVRFDSRHTFGESDGNPELMTASTLFADTQDVIGWAETQEWYKQPFFLAGHSLGALASGLYAEQFPNKVKAILPISASVAGSLFVEAMKKYQPDIFAQWRDTGIREQLSKSRPGLVRRLPWSFVDDLQKYDLTKNADKLEMPVCMIVGEQDIVTPLGDQQQFFSAIPGNKKELHIIQGAPHTFREQVHLDGIKTIMSNWISQLMSQ